MVTRPEAIEYLEQQAADVDLQLSDQSRARLRGAAQLLRWLERQADAHQEAMR